MIDTFKPGDRVFISEYGYGARAGRVIRTYADCFDRLRAVVRLDDQECPREVYADTVFATRAEAEADAKCKEKP